MEIDVKHDEKAGKYYAVIDGREAVCEYGPAGEGRLNFFHTYVPNELRGKGSCRRARPRRPGRRPRARPQGNPLLLVRPRLHRPAREIQGGAGRLTLAGWDILRVAVQSEDIIQIQERFRSELAQVTDLTGLDQVRRDYLGKNSGLKAALKDLRSVPRRAGPSSPSC